MVATVLATTSKGRLGAKGLQPIRRSRKAAKHSGGSMMRLAETESGKAS